MQYFYNQLYFHYFLSGFLFLIMGCSTGTEPINDNPKSKCKEVVSFSKSYANTNLSEEHVTRLAAKGGLLLANLNNKLYKKEYNATGGWEKIALPTNCSSVSDFIIRNTQKIMATISEYDTDTTRFYKSSDDTQIWNLIPTIHEERDRFIFAVLYIEQSPINESKLYGYTTNYVSMSNDGGRNWQKLIYFDGIIQFFKVSQIHPGTIFIGGQSNLYSPILAMTSDGGEKWQRLGRKVYSGGASVNDVILDHNNPKHILVGLSSGVSPGRVIKKSTDGGKTWETALQDINTYTFSRSARDPGTIYASGRNAAATLFFAVTSDFGETWEMIELEKGTPPVHVDDMVSVMQNGREVLYFATNKGVYNYRFVE